MQAVTPIVGSIAGFVVGPVGRWLCYSFQYGSNIRNLKNRVEELRGARERLQHDVDAALKNAEELEADVKNWLEKVGEIIQKAEEVLDKGKLRFANGECLNLKQRHQLSHKAKKIVQGVDDDKILEKGKFDRVGHRTPLVGIMTSTNYLNFESRQSIMVDLAEALKDTNTHVIGVWGMGGIGKTTLVTEVSKQAKGEKLFSEVATADVGQGPNLIRIQGQIADSIGLELDGEVEVGRAKHLAERLRKDTKILVVLDNVWNTLDLNEIGIPCEGSKVILISRDREVLRQMGTQKDFGLKPLHQKEARDLVGKTLGNSVEGSEFHEIANKIAEKCAGLPIALVVAFKGLKGKRIEEWKDALRRLKGPTHGSLIGMQSDIYSCIEVSYNRLESEEAKKIFLLCAQIPNNNLDEDLLEYYYGLYGLYFYSGTATLEEARCSVYKQVWYLKDSGLLQDCSLMQHCLQRSEHFHMHDVVRDFAKLTASKDHDMIVVGDGGVIKEWPAADVLERCKALSINGGILEMEFQESALFFVSGSCSFQGMEELTVMDFKNVVFSSFSPSVILFKNLRTLKLDCCMLKGISIIGNFENLAILSLRNSNIQKLPEEIRFLIHLRRLDLSWNFKLKVIPPEVFSKLKELEELYMGGTDIKWQVEGVNNERNNASLSELMNLPQLVTLEIDIKDANYLPNDLVFPELKRYKIRGGIGFYSFISPILRTLELEGISSFQLETTLRMLLKNVQKLSLGNLKGVNWVPHKLDWKDFEHLKHLQIKNSPMKHVFDSRVLDFIFPNLETLLLEDMINLEEIFHGQLSSECLDKLKVVEIYGCEKLKYFISLSNVGGLTQLEKLDIRNCSNMAAIVMKKEGEIEERQTTLLPQLQFLKLEYLSNLKHFLSSTNSLATNAGEITCKGKLAIYRQILHGEVMLPMLDELVIDRIGLEDEPQNQFLANKSIIQLTFNLSELEVNAWDNIKYLLSSSLKFMVQLTTLRIKQCKDLEEILLMEDLGMQEEQKLFPQLKELFLEDLPVLKRFCTGRNIKFPSLRELKVVNCPIMKTFVGKPVNSSIGTGKKHMEMSLKDGLHTSTKPFFSKVVAFSNLENLIVSNMVELEIIWPSCFPINSFCKLQKIIIECCTNLISIFQSTMLERFQNLELYITNCGSLEQVFDLLRLNVDEKYVVTTIQFKTLSLNHLPKLRHVWNKDPRPFFNFLNLQKVAIVECETLKSVFPSSFATYFMQLETLIIERCGVEEIFGREEVAHEILGQLPSKTFDKLRVVELKGCNNLKFFISLSVAGCLSQLERLKIRDCSNMATIIVKEGKIEERQTILFPKLRNLTLESLPKLKSFLSFPNSLTTNAEEIIQEGQVDCCTQILRGEVMLPMLDKLLLNRIGAEDVRQDQFLANKLRIHPVPYKQLLAKILRIRPPSMFLNVSILKVNGLGNTKYLLSSSLKFMVQLSDLQIKKCKDMEEVLFMEDLEMQEELKLFPQLKELFLEDLPILKRFCIGRNIKFPSLKVLKVVNCPIMKTFMGKLVNSGMSTSEKYMEMSLNDGLHTSTETFFSKVDAFPNLETLKICNVVELKIIWPSHFPINYGQFFNFQNLREVEANNCPSLKSLFPARAARHLMQLQNLVITKCGLEEIVATEEVEQPMDQIIFPQVKFLHLAELPRLKQFLLGVHALRNDKSVDKVSFPNLENLKICNVVELKIIWRSHFLVDSFCKLKKVHIESCENLTSIFQSNMLERFQNLEELVVEDCGSLEQVFDLQGLNVEERHTETAIHLRKLIVRDLPKVRHVWNKDPNRFFSFQNLQTVEANNCQNLKSLFPTSIARQLTQLERLIIINCGVEEIVAGDEAAQAMNQLIFPRVRFLFVRYLPRFKRFHPGLYTSEWPKLELITIGQCPFVCTLKRKEGNLEECQPGTCDKQVHFLFDTAKVSVDYIPCEAPGTSEILKEVEDGGTSKLEDFGEMEDDEDWEEDWKEEEDWEEDWKEEEDWEEEEDSLSS